MRLNPCFVSLALVALLLLCRIMTRGAGARRRANNARAARHQAKLALEASEKEEAVPSPSLAPGELVGELLLQSGSAK